MKGWFEGTGATTLGVHQLQQFAGGDVYQLRVMLHILGAYRPDAEGIPRRREAMVYTQDLVDAVDRFRAAGLSTPEAGSPRPGPAAGGDAGPEVRFPT
jgi:hypothetical protein